MAEEDGWRPPVLSAKLGESRRHNVIRGGFEAFYCAETAELVTFVMYLGAGFHDATDIAQQAMIEAYRSWDAIGIPRAWVRTVASRLWARHRFTDIPVEHVPDTPAPGWVDDVLHLAEEQQRVLDLLGSLPPAQSQALAWTYDGYTPSEIAAYTGIPAEKISSNLYKARKAVDKLLAAMADGAARKENQR